MTGTAALLVALALAVAAVDWIAVGMRVRRLEYVAKPLTMVLLTGAALALTPASPAQRSLFVAALVLSMVGDVFLMPPDERFFLPGLVAFAVGHVAYVAGFLAAGSLSGVGAVAGIAVVALALVAVGIRIVRAVAVRDPAMRLPVVVYMGVISAMVVCAFGHGGVAAPIGAALFFASDALIAWNRFVSARPGGRVAIIVTYHLAQVLLVVSLV